MKLRNPDLTTSFSYNRQGRTFHVFSLEIICSFSNALGRISYHIYGSNYEDAALHLGMVFYTPEDAFLMADRICSFYPKIDSDIDSYHFDKYPEFDKEVFAR